MSENLSAALQISLVGMSFVLGALALLWLAMALLVRLTAERVAPAPEHVTEPPTSGALKQRAAAAAVAVALARQPTNTAGPTNARPAPQVSPWQAVMRAQLLKQRERRR